MSTELIREIEALKLVKETLLKEVAKLEEKKVIELKTSEKSTIETKEVKVTETRVWKCTLQRTPVEKLSKSVQAENIFPHCSSLNLPDVLDYRSQLMLPRDQGSQGSCASFAASVIKEYQESIDCGKKGYMSPQFIYNNRQNKTSEGMYPGDVFDILSTKGSCSEKTFAYGSTQMGEEIPKEAFEEAQKYKIKSYAQVNTVTGVKTALYKNGPLYIAFPVYNFGKTFWKQTGQYDQFVGGHAVSVVGYLKDCFIIRNSWGTGWGDNGHTYLSFDELAYAWEIWCAVDEQSSKPDFISNLQNEVVSGCLCFKQRVKTQTKKIVDTSNKIIDVIKATSNKV